MSILVVSAVLAAKVLLIVLDGFPHLLAAFIAGHDTLCFSHASVDTGKCSVSITAIILPYSIISFCAPCPSRRVMKFSRACRLAVHRQRTYSPYAGRKRRACSGAMPSAIACSYNSSPLAWKESSITCHLLEVSWSIKSPAPCLESSGAKENWLGM